MGVYTHGELMLELSNIILSVMEEGVGDDKYWLRGDLANDYVMKKENYHWENRCNSMKMEGAWGSEIITLSS